MTDPREVIARYVQPTPLVGVASLSQRAGARVFCKVESGLPTGSFKVRGALHALARRLANGPVPEVVTASTGNHGAAVAFAASQHGIPATVFLPLRANPVKRDRIESLGATIIHVGYDIADAAAAARDHAMTTGAYLLDDATDPHVAAGASTIAAELLEQLPRPEAVFVPVGDSALIRGVGALLRVRAPQCRVTGVQSSGAPAYVLSWRAGRPITTDRCDTIADGLATRTPVAANVAALRAIADDMVLVSDDEIVAACRLLDDEGIRAEPAGAAAVAAVLSAGAGLRDRAVVALVTGGNPPNGYGQGHHAGLAKRGSEGPVNPE